MGLYYLHVCSENEGADQMRGHRASDLRLCFRTLKGRDSHVIHVSRKDYSLYPFLSFSGCVADPKFRLFYSSCGAFY